MTQLSMGCQLPTCRMKTYILYSTHVTTKQIYSVNSKRKMLSRCNNNSKSTFSRILCLKVKTKSDEIPLAMHDNFTNCIRMKVLCRFLILSLTLTRALHIPILIHVSIISLCALWFDSIFFAVLISKTKVFGCPLKY